MEQRLMAFWKYDLAPYYLGAEITEFKAGARVSVKGYDGYSFLPLRVMPLEGGEQILEKIQSLGYECSKIISDAQLNCRAAADKLLKL